MADVVTVETAREYALKVLPESGFEGALLTTIRMGGGWIDTEQAGVQEYADADDDEAVVQFTHGGRHFHMVVYVACDGMLYGEV